MTIVTQCSTCGAKYNISSEFLGKSARCKRCGDTFIIDRVDLPVPAGLDASSKPLRAWGTGDVIMDLYEVMGILGEGGMGTVYKVHHLGWNVDLAVKSPKPEELTRAGGAANFQREAETWVNLGLHPHIVSCYYVREIDGIPRVFAEYVDGGSLNDWIAGDKIRDLRTALDIAIQFAWGLQYAHEKGLVHQDVKPANVMMTSDGTAKVTDFGLSRALGRKLGSDGIYDEASVQSAAGSEGGMTPAFCSPEQANGEPLTIHTDVWSWAVSVMVIFLGEVTWPSGTVAGEVLECYIADIDANTYRIPMPRQVAQLLRMCFNAEPYERPRSMGDIVEALKEIYKTETGNLYPRTAPKISRATADSINNRAISLIDLGRISEAVKLWREAVVIEPHHPESTYNLGLQMWRTAQNTDSSLIRELEEVQKSHKDTWKPDYFLSLVHLERGDVESAIAVLDHITEDYGSVDEIKSARATAALLSGRGKRLLKVLSGHTGSVNAVTASLSGQLALSGGADKSLRLWDIQRGLCIKTLIGHASAINSVYLSNDGRYAISGSDDGSVRIWDVMNGYCLNTLRGHNGPVTTVSAVGDVMKPLSGSMDDTVKLWDAVYGHYLRSFGGHKGGVRSVTMTADGKQVFSAGTDGSIRLWDVTTLKNVHTLRGHEGSVNSISLSRDGHFLLSGGADKTVRLWDMSNRNCIGVFTGHVDCVQSVAFSMDTTTALSGSLDKSIKQWEVVGGRCIRTFEGHDDGICSIAVASEGRVALSGSLDGSVRVWNVSSPDSTYRAPMVLSQVLRSETVLSAMSTYNVEMANAISTMHDGDTVRTFEHIKNARRQKGHARGAEAMDLWGSLYSHFPHTAFNGTWEIGQFKEHSAAVNSVTIAAGSNVAASAGADRGLVIYDMIALKASRSLKGHGSSINQVALSVGGDKTITCSADGTLRRWDFEHGKESRVMRGHDGAVNSVALSRDDSLVLSCGDDCTVRVWEYGSGKCLRTFEGHDAPVLSVCFGLDGRFAISGGADGKVIQWEMTSAKFLGKLAVLTGHSGAVNSVALTLDGQFALSGSTDKTLCLWDLVNNKQVRTFEGHTGSVTSVLITADGRYGLSGSSDGTLGLWELSTGQCLRVFSGHDKAVNSVALRMDGKHALSACEDGSIKLWLIDWDMDANVPDITDAQLDPYLESFLNTFTPYVPGSLARRGNPAWKPENIDEIVYVLGCAGFGRIDAGKIDDRLKKLARQRMKK